MSAQPAPSTQYAVGLLAELIAQGVRDVVVCPGSRSQALALAAAEAERVGAMRLHVRVDERSAAYFALGIARETGMPAAVVVTSGTAVANLTPAGFEAHEGRVPLLLLTADRPHEMRGTRSNQTTRQAHLLADKARLSLDIDVNDALGTAASTAAQAVAAALGSFGGEPAGPVQLNLQFREPLSGDLTDAAELLVAAAARASEHSAHVGSVLSTPVNEAHDAPLTYQHDGDALTVVIAGEGAGPEAEQFAVDAGLPLLAEVVSGSRFGPHAITGYATLISDPQVGMLTERAVVFGHPTLTRQVTQLLRRDDVDVIVVDPHAGANVDHFDPIGDARVVTSASVIASYNPKSMRRWLGAWVSADRTLRAERSQVHEPDLALARAEGYKERNTYAQAELAAMREPVGRELLVDSVWRATWPHDRLVVAASRLVRVLDALAVPRKAEVRSLRGLSGIDGTVSFALGVATSQQLHDDPARAAGVTRVLLGDLALLHDAGSLLITPNEWHPRIQLFVANDGGGSIFDHLEVADSAERTAFDRVMFTPQQVQVEQLALAYGWQYRNTQTRAELETLLTEQVIGPQIIEVNIAR